MYAQYPKAVLSQPDEEFAHCGDKIHNGGKTQNTETSENSDGKGGDNAVPCVALDILDNAGFAGAGEKAV